jgi:hypothetical protein
MTGEGGGTMKELSDYLIDIPSRNTPRIQEAHMLLGHIICRLAKLGPAKPDFWVKLDVLGRVIR